MMMTTPSLTLARKRSRYVTNYILNDHFNRPRNYRVSVLSRQYATGLFFNSGKGHFDRTAVKRAVAFDFSKDKGS